MKHQVIDKYKGTKTLYPINGKIYTIRGKEQELYEEDTILNSNVEMYSITYYNNEICYLKEGVTYYKDNLLEKSMIPDSISGKHAIFTSEFNLDMLTLRFEVVDLETNETVCDLGIQSYESENFGKDSYFINMTNERIVVFYSKTKNVIEKSLNKILENNNTVVTKIISIFEGVLYIATKSNELISISLDDLRLIKKWNKIPDLFIGSMYKEVIPDATIFNLDIQKRRLIGLFHRCIIELNIDTQEIKYTDLTNSLLENNVNSFRPTEPLTITDKYILTVGHFDVADKPNIDFKGLIAMDKISFKIIDTFIFLDRDIGTRNPIVSGDNIYLVDWENNVHKFEVE